MGTFIYRASVQQQLIDDGWCRDAGGCSVVDNTLLVHVPVVLERALQRDVNQHHEVPHHALACALLPNATLAADALDLPVLEHMIGLPALRDMYACLPGELDLAACSSLTDLRYAVTHAVQNEPRFVLNRNHFQRALTSDFDGINNPVPGSHDDWCTHIASTVPADLQFLAGGFSNGMPPVTMRMLQDPVSGSLAPMGMLLLLLGSVYTPQARAGRFRSVGFQLRRALQQDPLIDLSAHVTLADQFASFFVQAQPPPALLDVSDSLSRPTEAIRDLISQRADVVMRRMPVLLRLSCSSLSLVVGFEGDPRSLFERAVLVGSSLHLPVREASIDALLLIDNATREFCSSLGYTRPPTTIAEAQARVAAVHDLARQFRASTSSAPTVTSASDGSAATAAATTDPAGMLALYRSGAYTSLSTQLLSAGEDAAAVLDVALRCPKSFGLSVVFSTKVLKPDADDVCRHVRKHVEDIPRILGSRLAGTTIIPNASTCTVVLESAFFQALVAADKKPFCAQFAGASRASLWRLLVDKTECAHYKWAFQDVSNATAFRDPASLERLASKLQVILTFLGYHEVLSNELSFGVFAGHCLRLLRAPTLEKGSVAEVLTWALDDFAARFAREAQGPVDVDRNLNFIRDAGARALNRLRELNDYCEEAANRASGQPLCSSFLLAADDSDASSAAGSDSDSFSASSPVRKRRPKRLSKQRSQQAKSTKQSPSKQSSQSSQLAPKSTKDKQSKRQRRSDAVDADPPRSEERASCFRIAHQWYSLSKAKAMLRDQGLSDSALQCPCCQLSAKSSSTDRFVFCPHRNGDNAAHAAHDSAAHGSLDGITGKGAATHSLLEPCKIAPPHFRRG